VSPEVLAPLIVCGGMVCAVIGALVVWRVWFAPLYPRCHCAVCGKRDR